MKKKKKIVKSLFIIIISVLLLGFAIHTIYVQAHRAEVVE